MTTAATINEQTLARAQEESSRETDYGLIDNLEEARQFLFRYADSYSRLPWLIDLYYDTVLPPIDVLRLLGEEWTMCDNLETEEFADEVTTILTGYGEFPIRPMMTRKELYRWRSLPDMVTIYRGCSRNDPRGFSWSLSKDVADRFPFLNRYLAPDPVVLTAEVKKIDIIAVKLDRAEEEIITLNATVLDVQSAVSPSARTA